MSHEKIHVVTDLPKPSLLKRLPLKKGLDTAAAVVLILVAGKLIKDHVNVSVESTETSEA